MRSLVTIAAILVSLASFCPSAANAITIGGSEYDAIASFTTLYRLGYWNAKKKYFTSDNVANSAIPINNVLSVDPILDDYSLDEFYLMGTTATSAYDTALATGLFELKDENGVNLLTATYSELGFLDSTRISGAAGGLALSGIFTVNGGLLSSLGLVNGPIYIQASFDYVTGLHYSDMQAKNGTVVLYARAGDGSTTVPEPGTLVLLSAGLLGSTRARRSKKVAV